MELVVWNSQGAKWDTFWTNYINPLNPGTTDILGLLVEAGWAPWIQSGEVTINNVYDLDSGTARYDALAAANSAFCTGISLKRGRKAYWVPWVKTLDAMKTNSRCSMGAALLPGGNALGDGTRYDFTDDIFTRPVFRFDVKRGFGRGSNPIISVFLVHLVSGYRRGAQAEIDYLTSGMSKLVPQGADAIVVGDMNIDLLASNVRLPDKWFTLSTNGATQQSGGELDYALVYDPAGRRANARVQVVQQYKSGTNQSDHSVLRYTIPIR